MTNALMASLQPELNAGFPDIAPGDTVRVHQRIVEGRNERIQTFQGVIVAMRGGKSAGATYTVPSYRRTWCRGRAYLSCVQHHCGEGRSAAQGTRPSRHSCTICATDRENRPDLREKRFLKV
jgi:large subunit ribosomal protein L19